MKIIKAWMLSMDNEPIYYVGGGGKQLILFSQKKDVQLYRQKEISLGGSDVKRVEIKILD